MFVRLLITYFLSFFMCFTAIPHGFAQLNTVPSGTYEADENHTNVLWSVKHFGLSNYYGRFDKIKAILELDSKNPEQSQVKVVIDPQSVNTNYHGTPNQFNQEIAGEKFFNSEKFDKITFISKTIHQIDDKTGTISGDLTFHGVTRPVILDVTFNHALNPHPFSKKAVLGFSATATIKRSDFGVNAFLQQVSDEVKLIIEAEFVQQ